MTNTNKLTDKEQAERIEQAKDISDETIFNINEKNSALAAEGCGVCERKGFPIFLVRKTVIAKNFDNQSWSTNVKSLGHREPNVDLVSHEWAYRTLRKGFVYILLNATENKTNNYQYLFYEVTPSGVLRHTTVKQPIEKNVREIPESCIKDGHQYKGLFANIDTSVYSGDAYIAYSRRAWSRKTLKTYRVAANEGNLALLARFSKINISEDSKKAPNKLSTDKISRSFPLKDFEGNTKLLEFNVRDHFSFEYNDSGKMCLIAKDKIVENPSLLKFINTINPPNSMSSVPSWPDYQFTTAHQFNRLNYNKVKNEIPQKSVDTMSVLVLEDTMAIAEELAYSRRVKLQPLSQALIESEEITQNAASEAYKKLLGNGSEKDAFIDYDKVFKAVAESTPKSHHWAQNIDGERFDYFSEKSMYLKKVMQYVDSYEMQIKSHIKESSEDLIVYKYSYYPRGTIIGKHSVYKDQHGKKVDPYDGSYNISKVPTRPLTEDEIPMQQKEQDRIDKEEKGNYRVEVTVYPVKNAETVYQERLQKEWEEKYQVQLNLETKSKALEKMEKNYEQVIAFIKKHSSDYYMYLTWLFGGNGRAQGVIAKSKKTQQQENLDILPTLEAYNESEFWLREWDTNGSNNHIGYLCDFVNILDDCQVGNIKVPYQFAVWDLLLFDNKSLYYHIIHGINGDLVTLKDEKADSAEVDEKEANKSWWDLLLKVRIDINSLTPEKYEELRKKYLANKIQANVTNLEQDESSAADKEKIERRAIALTKLINDHKNELNDLFFVEKGLVLLELFDVLVMRMNSALAQEQERIYTEKSVLDLHLYQIGMVLNGQPILRLKIEKIAVKNVPILLDLFYGIDGYKIPDVANDEDDNTEITLSITTTAKSAYELYTTLEPIFTFDSGITSFTDFWAKIKTNFTTEATTGGLSSEFSVDKLDLSKVESFKSTREMTFEYSGIVLGSICLYFSVQDMKKTEAELNSFGLGQIKIEELRAKYMIAVTNNFVSIIGLISSTMGAGVKSLSQTSFLRLSSLQVAKGAFATIKLAGATAGIIGGAIGVIEGLISYQQAKQKREKGGQYALLYMVGAGLQLVSSALSIIGSLCIFAGFPPAGALLLLVAMAIGLVTAVTLLFFQDESDKWNPMQNWLSRCAFGQQDHPDKGKPYPVTSEGMAFLSNDYVIARMGLKANIEFNDEHYLVSSISKMKGQLEREANYKYNDYRSYDIDRQKYPTVESYQEFFVQENMNSTILTKAIYLVMQLAKEQKDQPNNYFEGTLAMDYQNEQVVIGFQKNIADTRNINISLSINKSVTFFARRTSEKLLLDEKNIEDKKTLGVGKGEIVGNKKDDKTGEYFAVNYKLGEGFTWGVKCYLRCKYWVNGKVDPNSGKTNIPILLHYKYPA